MFLSRPFRGASKIEFVVCSSSLLGRYRKHTTVKYPHKLDKIIYPSMFGPAFTLYVVYYCIYERTKNRTRKAKGDVEQGVLGVGMSQLGVGLGMLEVWALQLGAGCEKATNSVLRIRSKKRHILPVSLNS